MTLTSNIMATRDFAFLVMGAMLLNWVLHWTFHFPWCEDVDFVLLIITLIMAYVYGTWITMTMYGVMLP